jgi:CO/xanthine dehydrogenase FAD-binding subunit
MPIEPPVTSPRDLDGAYAALAAAPADAPARPIAGGTDLMVALTGELGEPPASVVDLWAIDALRGIAIDGAALVLGALTTYTDIRRSPLCREHVPALVEAAATIGAAQIQNRGTLGGNITNASPAGDTLPVLLAADAVFVLGSGRGEREVPATDFWTAYRRTALAADELLLRIRIPLVPDREMRFRKIGTRRAQSISKVVLAAAWRSDAVAVVPRGAWRDVRVALGSVAATPIRARATEAVLEGKAPTPETSDLAAETLAGELSPIEDVRSTAEYRRLVAARVLHRIVREAGGW